MNDRPQPERLVLTPSQLNRDVKITLEQAYQTVWIEGEVSNLATPASGHVYFSLKDAKAQIRCALFKGKNRSGTRISNGDQILVRGQVTLYAPRGDYQLVADFLEPAGEGELRRQFEALKQKLNAQGLFDDTSKKVLPAFPRTLCIVTSPSGAAIQDVLNVLSRRFPALSVVIIPSLVQGDQAAVEITTALTHAIALEPDAILITRGGGSLEDLWAFNDETLARTIHQSAIPVVTAIGHEIDFTIADFVADLRAPTPSAAAELLTPDQSTLKHQIKQLTQQLKTAMNHQVNQAQQMLDRWSLKLESLGPKARLTQRKQTLDHLQHQLKANINRRLHSTLNQLQLINTRLLATNPARNLNNHKKYQASLQNRLQLGVQSQLKLKTQHLHRQQHALRIISPLAVLERGYAISTDEQGQVLQDVTQLNPGQTVQTRLAKGEFSSKVTQTSE